MNPTSGNNSYALAQLEKAYEIAKYMHSLTTEDINDNTKPCYRVNHSFTEGPRLNGQTKRGLYLEGDGTFNCTIHTPIGAWTVTSVSAILSVSEKAFDALKEPLGLKLIDPASPPGTKGPVTNVWAITKWKGETLDMPEPLPLNEMYTEENIHRKWHVWNEFASKHTDLKCKNP